MRLRWLLYLICKKASEIFSRKAAYKMLVELTPDGFIGFYSFFEASMLIGNEELQHGVRLSEPGLNLFLEDISFTSF